MVFQILLGITNLISVRSPDDAAASNLMMLLSKFHRCGEMFVKDVRILPWPIAKGKRITNIMKGEA